MSGLSFVVDPEDGSAEAAERARRAERALREIHEANNLEQIEFDNEIDCSVLGDGAYKVTWDTNEKRVRVTAPDVQGLFVWPWGRRRLAVVAGGVALRARARGGGDAVRATPRSVANEAERAHDRRGVDRSGLRAVDRRRALRVARQPVRLHPVRHLPERTRAEAVLGCLGPRGAEGAAA